MAAAMTWGVPHPSGYPTYILLARLFALLPLGPLARRFNLFSAAMAALASVLTAMLIQRLAVRDTSPQQPSWWRAVAGAVGGLLLVVAPAVWSQALITEVYTLHLAIVAGLYLFAASSKRIGVRQGLVMGVLVGLGFGNHLTLALALPGIVILCWPRMDRQGGVASVLGAILGLGIYTYVPVAAARQPPVNWGNPTTPSAFWWLVSGRLYHRYAFASSWSQVWRRLLAAISLWRDQFGLLGVALTPLGIYAWLERRRWRLLLGMVSVCVFTLAYAVTYNTADSMLYLLPAYLVGAAWIISGGEWLARVVIAETRAERSWAYLLLTALLVAMPAFQVTAWHDVLDLSDDHEAETWLSATLGVLPEDAVLLTVEDRHTFALWYALYARERRSDLLVVDADLYVEPWYRMQIGREARLGDPPPATVSCLIEIVSLERPVYVGTNRIDFAQQYDLTRQGSVWALTQREGP